MEEIVGVSQVYYDLTHRIVERLNHKALISLSQSSNISFSDLREFRCSGKIGGEYILTLYSQLFGKKTPLQATVFLEEELTEYVECINKG